MDIELISLKSLHEGQKKKRRIWFFLVFGSLLLVAFTVVAYRFQNRSSQTLWIVFGSVLTWLWLIVIGYMVIKMLAPLDHYLQFMQEALSKPRVVNDVKVTILRKDIETYRGFRTLSIEGIEADEETQMTYRYEASETCPFQVGRVYEIEAYDDVVVRLRELK